MGCIQIPGGIPNFTKAVISFWFRVPQESIDKCKAAAEEDFLAPFAGVIPLLVMGQKGTGNIPFGSVKTKALFYNTTSYDASGFGNTESTVDIGGHRARQTFTYNPGAHIQTVTGTIEDDFFKLSVDGDAPPTVPVFIGLNTDGNTLFVNFETNQKPAVSGYAFSVDSVTPGSIHGHGASNYSGPIPSQPGPHDAYPIGTRVIEYDWAVLVIINVGNEVVIEDTTGWQPWPIGETVQVDARKNYRDYSDIAISATGAIQSDEIEITPDHWHHALISLELNKIETHGTGGDDASGPITPYVDGAAKLYVALDDVNYTGWDLSNEWTEGDPNEVITAGASSVAGEGQRTDDKGNVLGNPLYVLNDPKIPCSEGALGIPATAEFIDKIFKVEMAELQFFTGVTLDPGQVGNRRAFVDADGVPVPPLSRVDQEGNIIPPPAVQLLGKNPELLLHGSRNWSNGYNTGTLGVTVDGEGNQVVIPSGQFNPTGQVLTWRPDPTLHGPQNPTPPPPSVRLSRKPVAVE